jgi:hypothetical protein
MSTDNQETTVLPQEGDKVLVEFQVMRVVDKSLIKVGKGNISFWLAVDWIEKVRSA